MKLFKALILTLSAVLLTGCYTQLRYSQTMHRITEDRGYDQDEEYYEDDEYYGDAGVPVYYKDYDYAEGWAVCGCNPYDDYYYGTYAPFGWRHYYRPYYSSFFYDWNPYYPWRHHRYFAGFSFSIHFGSPYYHSFFYDPFFYSAYYYPYHGFFGHPLAYNYFYFYNSPGYFYGDDNDIRRNVRYAPRSIGTGRVIDRSDRSERIRARRGQAVERSATVRSRSEVRTRSAGSSRVRGTVERPANTRVKPAERNRGESVKRSRGDHDRSDAVRSRSTIRRVETRSERSVQRDRNRRFVPERQSNIIRYRRLDSDNDILRIDSRQQIRERLQDMRIPRIDYDRSRQSRPDFYQRLRNFFDSDNSRIINRTNWPDRRSIRSHRSSDRPVIKRSSRSRSSSVNRSRSSSSRSRDRDDGNSRSRSRGNN